LPESRGTLQVPIHPYPPRPSPPPRPRYARLSRQLLRCRRGLAGTISTDLRRHKSLCNRKRKEHLNQDWVPRQSVQSKGDDGTSLLGRVLPLRRTVSRLIRDFFVCYNIISQTTLNHFSLVGLCDKYNLRHLAQFRAKLHNYVLHISVI
jgi:hypothetical protein